MTLDTFSYRLESPDDHDAIERLHAEAFGPGRFARAAFRLREGIPHEATLSFVAVADGRLVASVRLTPITVGPKTAMLLGPLAVDPPFKGRGAGRRLVRMAVEKAHEAGHAWVLLVGDLSYYGPLGFEQIPPGSVTLPAPAHPDRILVAPLVPGVLDGFAGAARPFPREAISDLLGTT